MNPSSKPRLVIFGCGYVGTAVARWALERGLQVTALTRNRDRAAGLRGEGIDAVVADLAGSDWHGEIAGAPEFVVNCVSSGGGGLEGYRRSYVDGMASVVAWARRAGPVGTMVYTGSTSVYPQGDGAVVDESAPVRREDASERARLLIETENILCESTGVARRRFVLRLAGIYGPGRHHFIDQVRAGEASGNAETHLNLAHRDDIVAAIWACLTAPPTVAGGVFNVVDDRPARKAEVVAWVAARLGLEVPVFTGSALGARRGLTPDRVISNGRLKATLGWAPRYPTFREGAASLLSR